MTILTILSDSNKLDYINKKIVGLFILMAAIIIGNILRRKIPFLRKGLVPSALLGGLLIFLLKFYKPFNDLLDQELMELITYHALGLGFIAVSLKTVTKNEKSSKMKVVETGALTASSYIIQGICGLLISLILCYATGFFHAAGLLLPMGFGQGPAQAYNFGKIYGDEYGFSSGKSFGLTIATIGFLVASAVGVTYMNILKKRKKLTIATDREDTIKTVEDFETENEIPNTESIDKLTVLFGIVFSIYGIVCLFMFGISKLPLGNFGENTLFPLIWGFNFIWSVIFATVAKKIMQFLMKKKVMHRHYTNNYLLDRIGGLMFDTMIIAGTAAIQWEKIKDLIPHLILICSVGTIVTFFFVLYACKHLYPDYKYEAFFTMFGMLTGTASNGMILLREIDPKFKTPAADNLVYQSLPAIVFGLPILLLMGYAPKGKVQSWITLGLLCLFFVCFCLFIFRTKIFSKKKKSEDMTSD